MKKIPSYSSYLVPLKEFRLNAQKYIDALENGSSFVVMKRSRPVFRLGPVDETWETVVDFRSINKNGVDARDVLRYL